MTRAVLTVAAAGLALAVGVPRDAEAAYVATMQQVGSDVVVTGNGSFNLAAKSLQFSGSAGSAIRPNVTYIAIGSPLGSNLYTNYFGPTSIPAAFGTGGFQTPDFGSGDFVAVGSSGGMLVPFGYVSGNSLASSMTFSSDTFATLGVTVGTYVWSWGSGATADTFTLNILDPNPPVGVPAPPALALFGVGLAGLLAVRRRRG